MSEPLPDRSRLSEVLRTLAIHEHLCVIYDTREQQSDVTVPFLRIGLDRGEKCLYVADEKTTAHILEAMRAQGVEVDAAAEKGTLKFANEGQVYLKKGYFDPDETISYWAGMAGEAKAAGFPALRFAGDLTWALEGKLGTERLFEYEARLNRFLTEYDAVCICQYNNKRFTAEIILQVLRTHPLLIYGGQVCKNPYYIPPDEFLKPNQPEAELHRWLDNIQTYEKIERALRTAKDEWEQSFNAISDLVFIVDKLGIILRVNRSMGERYEPIHGNLTGLDYRQVYRGPIQQDPAAPWEAALSGGAPVSFETKLPPFDGWYTVSSYPLYDDEHQQWGAIFMVRDITKRKRVEEALRLSEQEQRRITAQLERERARLVEAQEMAKVGSWEAELSTLNVIWSEQTHRIFETDPSRFHPTRPKFREFIHPEDRSKVDAAFVASLDKRSPCTVEYRIVMPDGRVKILEERWQTFQDEEGKPVRVAGTCRDITERVRAAQELQHLSGKLLRLQDEERRKIARDLHDSTGQALVALATTLAQLRDAIPSSNRKARKLTSDSQALADTCIREIRTLAYLLHPPMLDESGLEDAVREYVEGFAKRSGIRVKLDLPSNLGRSPRNVELALFRVVQESLTNIQRHSGSRQARIRIERNPKGITLEVSDKGRRASRSGRKRTQGFSSGTGVGIPSMDERVKQIGGQMEIKSDSEGTTVLVTVPANE
jgi:PAS domain S-box-containing protein